MQKSYRLTESDIKEAIRAYIRSQEGEDTSAPWDVMLVVTPGDRPGETDTISATASPGYKPRHIDPLG